MSRTAKRRRRVAPPQRSMNWRKKLTFLNPANSTTIESLNSGRMKMTTTWVHLDLITSSSMTLRRNLSSQSVKIPKSKQYSKNSKNLPWNSKRKNVFLLTARFTRKNLFMTQLKLIVKDNSQNVTFSALLQRTLPNRGQNFKCWRSKAWRKQNQDCSTSLKPPTASCGWREQKSSHSTPRCSASSMRFILILTDI